MTKLDQLLLAASSGALRDGSDVIANECDGMIAWPKRTFGGGK